MVMKYGNIGYGACKYYVSIRSRPKDSRDTVIGFYIPEKLTHVMQNIKPGISIKELEQRELIFSKFEKLKNVPKFHLKLFEKKRHFINFDL